MNTLGTEIQEQYLENMKGIQIYQGDCLERMKDIPDGSIDMVLCDLPYSVLNKSNPNAQWDRCLPMDNLWKEYKRVVKKNGAIILFASGMFTAQIMMSNPKMWRYNLIWKKGNRPTGFLNAKKMPLRNHEDICVFYNELPTYNPQMWKGQIIHGRKKNSGINRCYGKFDYIDPVMTDMKYPISVNDIPKEHSKGKFYHPTQKPVALCEYLIKTYTNEGDTVLDNCAGSFSTGVACVNTNRNFIGIELEQQYCDIGEKRILDAIENRKNLFNQYYW